MEINLNNKFSSSAEVFSWLSKHINLERGQRPKSFRLERMEVLAELAGCPHRCAPSIHIAGSKGEGSVTSMLTAMLTASGLRAARYMSPHVTDIRERICLGDSFFSEDVYCKAGDELRNIAESPFLSQQAAALFNECEPTFWELLTLLFFLCARQSKCDVMVVETGMGGRLDSTNIVDPLVSIITLIELEHTNFLGNTITEIAGEKAGIIKQGKPLVLAKQNDEALEVFKNKAKEKNSPLYYFPEIAELSDIKITPQGTEFFLAETQRTQRNAELLSEFISFPKKIFDTTHRFFIKNPSYQTNAPRALPNLRFEACASARIIRISIPGKVQAENAALAITALKIAFPNINEDAIHKGLKNLKIPARFEKIANEPTFIIDGAHTPESLTLCIETFCSLYGEGGVLIFGCAADKDAAAMALTTCKTNGQVGTRFQKIIITTPGTFKISDPAQVYEAFAAIAGKEKTALVADTNEAVRQARELRLPILATGSFYLAAEIRKIVLS